MRATAALCALVVMAVLAGMITGQQHYLTKQEEKASVFLLWCARHAGRGTVTASRVDGRLKYHVSCHHGGAL